MAGKHVLATAKIRGAENFEIAPEAEARAALAERLGLRGLRKLSFRGTVGPAGDRDLALDATLGATLVQDCVVTGDPVVTRIDAPVTRRYLADWVEPEGDEVEIPEDESAEPLPSAIDLFEVMAEALALEVPPFPRAEGVEPVDLTVAGPGVEPMTDEDARPFAGLKELRDKLKDDDE